MPKWRGVPSHQVHRPAQTSRRIPMSIVRYRQWPGNSYGQQSRMQHEIRQAFDRLFEGNLLDQDESDDSSVVTSQWVPRVDVKEEQNRFVLYADLPGIDPDD